MSSHLDSKPMALHRLLLPWLLAPCVLWPMQALGAQGTATVYYASAGPGTTDGYENASIQVEYHLLNCAGAITISVQRVRNSVSASPRYWFDGSQVEASAPPPEAPLVRFRGDVMHGGNLVGRFSIEAGDSLGFGCYTGDTQAVGKLSDHIGPKAIQADIASFLNALTVRVDTTDKPLTNGAVAQAARAARDKAKREEEARQREEQKRQQEAEAKQRQEEARAQREAEQARRQQEKEANADASKPVTGSTDDTPLYDDWGQPISRSSATQTQRYVRSQDGGYYRQDTGGQYHQVNEAEYRAAMEEKQQTAKAEAERQHRDAQQEQLNQVLATQQRRQQDLAYMSDQIDRKVEGFAQSFYAGQRMSQARDNIASLTTLRGDYADAEELEADFERRMYSLRQELRNLEYAAQQQRNAATELYFSDDPQVGELMNMIGTIASNSRQEREQREAEERLQRARERALADIEKKRAEMVVQMRMALLEQFPDGDVPLSSQNIPVDTLYFFAYTVDKNQLRQPAPAIALVSTFAVQRHGDGTWPFKRSINREIHKVAPGDNTLVGFYASEELARSMRASFLKLAASSGYVVREVEYNRVASPNASADGSQYWETKKSDSKETDFWGGSSDDNKKQESTDFW